MIGHSFSCSAPPPYTIYDPIDEKKMLPGKVHGNDYRSSFGEKFKHTYHDFKQEKLPDDLDHLGAVGGVALDVSSKYNSLPYEYKPYGVRYENGQIMLPIYGHNGKAKRYGMDKEYGYDMGKGNQYDMIKANHYDTGKHGKGYNYDKSKGHHYGVGKSNHYDAEKVNSAMGNGNHYVKLPMKSSRVSEHVYEEIANITDSHPEVNDNAQNEQRSRSPQNTYDSPASMLSTSTKSGLTGHRGMRNQLYCKEYVFLPELGL